MPALLDAILDCAKHKPEEYISDVDLVRRKALNSWAEVASACRSPPCLASRAAEGWLPLFHRSTLHPACASLDAMQLAPSTLALPPPDDCLPGADWHRQRGGHVLRRRQVQAGESVQSRQLWQSRHLGWQLIISQPGQSAC